MRRNFPAIGIGIALLAAGILLPPARASGIAPIFQGCKTKDRQLPHYPLHLLNRRVQGRIILNIERDPQGTIRVQNVEISNPYGVFDDVAKRTVTNWKCDPISSPMLDRVAIIYSIRPGIGFPHFDNAITTIEIDATMIDEKRPYELKPPEESLQPPEEP